jgi:hypothetical protein
MKRRLATDVDTRTAVWKVEAHCNDDIDMLCECDRSRQKTAVAAGLAIDVLPATEKRHVGFGSSTHIALRCDWWWGADAALDPAPPPLVCLST